VPCNDVSEYISITVDQDDCFKSYVLIKGTCGRGVGLDSLLQERLAGRSVKELLNREVEELLEDGSTGDELLEFLGLKHLLAIRATLQVYAGLASGGLASACTVSGISYEEAESTIDAVIDVDLLTSEIEACGGCGGG
jgi:hypothetical protein